MARPALAGLYVASVGLLGVLTAAAFDPQAEGCLACPHNLMLVHGEPAVAEAATRWGLRLGLVSAVTVAGVLTWRAASAARLTSATTAAAPAAAAAYLALVAVELEHSLHRNFLSNDPFDIRVSHWEAATLVALAGGVALGLRRARRARSAVAKLVIEDAASPAAGQVRDALAQALGDPTLRLAYRRDAGDYVDTHGRPTSHPTRVRLRRRSFVSGTRSPCSSTTRGCSTVRASPRMRSRPHGSQSRTSGSRQRCEHSSKTCGAREYGSSKRQMRRGGALSETCTTAHNKPSSVSHCASGC
ncbi:MAG: hypothetical protein ACJ77E_15945 [Gaiellaceae bacterium]